MSSDSPINRPWQPEDSSSTSKNYALSGKIMLTSIIILFVVVIFLLLLHLYARWYLLRLHRQTRRRHRRNRSSRIVFTVDNNQPSPSTGLASSVLNTLPLFIYSEKNGKCEQNDDNALECAVCLAEFEEGEKGRLLPKCKHSFHTECIDMWFFSHSTCPLCRSAVEPVEIEPETTSLADRRKGIDVRIDVPTRTELATETELPSQGFKSPGGTRLLSFKRIISMSRKSPAVSPSSGVGPSSLPVSTESDLESAIQESEVESTQSETVIFR